MNAREIYLCKTALRVLNDAGTQGVGYEAWMEQIGISAQTPLTTAEKEWLLDHLDRNGWVRSYRDPILDQVRYVLSGQGSLAMGVL